MIHNLITIMKQKTKAIDHNGYIKGTEFFLASYTAGLRVLDVLNIDQKSILN